MLKYLVYKPYSPNGEPLVEVIESKEHIKTADVSSELEGAILSIERKPGKMYILVNALSAGDYYGPNRNGDYFSEDVLMKYHKTFEALGYVFKHHRNKIHRGDKAYGKVLFSYYNKDMHRVELIVELDKEKAPDIVKRIEAGDLPAVSMGTKVPFDVCSICGNKAKTAINYCEHIKRPNRNKVDPKTGKKAYLINTQPKFFDISFVTIPADKTASVLQKVASVAEEAVKLATEIAEDFLKESGIKEADIVKKIEGTIEAASDDPKGLIQKSQPDLSQEKVNDLCAKGSLEKILSSLLALRIMPSRRTFQRLVLTSNGERDLSQELDKKDLVFPYNYSTNYQALSMIHPENLDPAMLELLEDEIKENSLTKPLIVVRIIKRASLNDFNGGEKIANIDTDTLGEMYYTYYNQFNSPRIKKASLKVLSGEYLNKLAGYNFSGSYTSRDLMMSAPQSFVKDFYMTDRGVKVASDLHALLKTASNEETFVSNYWKLSPPRRDSLFEEMISI